VITYPEAVAPLFHAAQKSIAVSGTHGKSTTSAMLAVTLEHLGRDVDAIVGAVVKNWKSNAHLASRRGRSRAIFVLEADEYRHAFLHYEPSGAIVTSVEWDHPDAFPTSVSYVRAFRTFVQNIREGGFLVLSGDDRVARRLADDMSSSVRVMSYGFREENTVRISTFAQRSFGIEFSLKFGRRDLGLFRVGLYGRHHAYNAAAVVAAALALGEKPSAIRRALAAFRGTVRRFDVRCRRPLIVDDYAHHPSEIVATIEAARAAFPGRRVRVLFQPHTYTRTAALFDDFVSALRGADECTILKTYSSARETLASLRGRKEMKRATSEELASALRARHVANPSLAIRLYEKTLKEDDVLLVVGAGIGNIVAEELSRRRCCDRRNDG
jgi:UDP-N-acetylmuramate--alanine ligase